MHKFFSVFLSSLLLLSAASGAAELAKPAAPAPSAEPVKLGAPMQLAKEITTPYGLKAWLFEEHSLPIVSISLAFRKAGYAYDPVGKEGLAKMVASLMDDGAGTISGAEFKKRLESSAITLEFSEDADNFYVSIKSLTEHIPEALSLLRLALTAPMFEAQAVERSKSQMLNLLAQRDDDPESLASLSWQRAFFASAPYAKSGYGSKESISAIGSDDLKNYVTSHLNRAQLIISIAGDIKEPQLRQLLDEHLANLPLLMSKESPFAEITGATGSTILIDKSIPQSIAVFGQKGLGRNHPDFYALYVLNYILGGGSFESRLMKAVREEKGLAYTVYSFIDLSDYAGLIKGFVATQNPKIHDSLSIIKDEMARLKKAGITETELQHAKDYLMLSFPLKLDKTDNVAEFLTNMQLYHLGINFLNVRNDYIKNVTLADVNRVAREVLDPEHLTIVIIGNKKEQLHDK